MRKALKLLRLQLMAWSQDMSKRSQDISVGVWRKIFVHRLIHHFINTPELGRMGDSGRGFRPAMGCQLWQLATDPCEGMKPQIGQKSVRRDDIIVAVWASANPACILPISPLRQLC